MNKIVYQGKGERLDIFMSGFWNVSRNQTQKCIEEGQVLVNGKAGKSNIVLEPGDKVEITEKKAAKLKAIIPRVDVAYEDENIIAVNKDPGIVVYPDANHKTGTVLDALRSKIGIKGEERPGVVHRLDKDTSGLMVFARNKETEEYLKKEIKDRKFQKTYAALVWGKVIPKEGIINIPIKRSEKNRKKMEALSLGKEALTEYSVVQYYKQSDTWCRICDMTLLKVKIITGRTHQIRVHLSAIGYPVVGDKTYGRKDDMSGLNRQFLHATDLSFALNGKKYKLHSDLPKDLVVFIDSLEVNKE